MSLNNRHEQRDVILELDPTFSNINRFRPRTSSRTGHDMDLATSDAETLLDPDRNRGKPPVVRPEMDDDEDFDNIPFNPEDHPGVDDGFFPVAKPNGSDKPDINVNGVIPRRRPSRPFPIPPTFEPGGFIDVNQDGIPDVNVYQHKKTLAQGMMDLALLSANANQLRYVLESYKRHPYYYVSLTLISISLFFQIAVGVGLILNSRYNVKDDKQICKANKINNFTIIGVFIVTVVNVFISAFGVAEADST